MNESIRITREELYDLVWSEPMSSVAKRYRISDRGLAKVCERLKVPRPGRGYWAKKRAGHRVSRRALKTLAPGARESAVVRTHAGGDPAPEPSGPVAEQKAFESKEENRITVPDRVGRYHPLVRATRVALRELGPRVGGSVPRGALDIRVERRSRQRAFRIFDALIKALEKRGYSVSIDAGAGTGATVGDTRITIALEERYRQEELPITKRERSRARLYQWDEPRPDTKRVPTGELMLKITDGQVRDVRRTWADGKKQRVEACLNSFVVGLVRAAEAKSELQRTIEERERRWEEDRRAAELRRTREREEQARIKDLMDRVERWERAERIRRFLDVARSGVVEDDSIGRPGWLEWAERYLVRLESTTLLIPERR
jgi:hypothetical protein